MLSESILGKNKKGKSKIKPRPTVYLISEAVSLGHTSRHGKEVNRYLSFMVTLRNKVSILFVLTACISIKSV